MVKTKTVKRSTTLKARKPKQVPAAAAAAPAHRSAPAVGCASTACFLCLIFKLMITVFLVMLVFWIGFSFGSGITNDLRGKGGPVGLPCSGPICHSDSMSRGMSPVSMERMMADMTAMLANKEGESFDKEFLIQMTVHHEGAIEMAKMAIEKSSSAEIKSLAEKIIAAQEAEIEQMKSWQAAE